ncbi:TRAP transporter large permease [Paracoccus sp. M683]|uniref:TRAP transporter large permease n=1 Tax=Paracoccus sp. M683 TaxID=2594268 RepID=UPI00117C8AD1|nr:TRAP transporter large permease [Paracoccus sp. M683]TRW99250.1 TRAP transporter large permease [Paracoccus sp. M683]
MDPVLLMFLVFGLAVLAGVPIAFALILATLPPVLMEPRLTDVMLSQRIFNSLDSFVLLAVPFFLLAGNLMNASGVTDRLIRYADARIGHIRGGIAHVNVLVSMLFAGVSGSSTADTAGVGSVLIPAMQRKGFSAAFSVAVTAASSVLGTIIPPSITLIVWGAVTNTSVSQLFAAGVLPGIMIAGAQMIYIALWCRRHHVGTQGIKAPRSERRAAFLAAAPGMVLPLILLGGILFGIATPTEASILAVVYAILVGAGLFKELSAKAFVQELVSSVRLMSLSLFCLGAAGFFAWLLTYYGVPQLIAGYFDDAQSPLLLLLGVALVCLVLGLFLDSLVIIVIIGPLFLPAITAAGVDPVQYGIVACVSLSLGLVTPPYGLCLLIASSIAKIGMHKALGEMSKIFGVMLIVLGLLIVIPQITIWPAMLMR